MRAVLSSACSEMHSTSLQRVCECVCRMHMKAIGCRRQREGCRQTDGEREREMEGEGERDGGRDGDWGGRKTETT